MTFTSILLMAVFFWLGGHLGSNITGQFDKERHQYINCPKILWLILGMPRSVKNLPKRVLNPAGMFLLILGEILLLLGWLFQNEKGVVESFSLCLILAVFLSWVILETLKRFYLHRQ